jgi:DNA (cytosine-5)-methyltransferase 1
MISYLSVCSGIEAASVAWKPLGWEAVAFAEVEPFPCSVLAHHYPETPNWGDMTKWKEWPDAAVDLLVGGTPCQSFSVAGLRGGLNDPRGGLMLQFLGIADRYRPRWIVWENVPGVLSSNSGRDFGTFLGSLGELGYGWAYRVLDAQWFGVAQRRRRVFVVGCLGDQRSAAAVLFERESVRRDTPPRREAWQKVARDIAPDIAGSLDTRCGGEKLTHQSVANGHVIPAKATWWDGGQVSQTLDAVLSKGQTMPEKNRFPAVLVPETCGPLCTRSTPNGNGMAGVNQQEATSGQLIPVVAFPANLSGTQCASTEGVACNLQAKNPTAVAIGTDCYNGAITGDVAATIGTPGSSVNASGPTVAVAPSLTASNDPSRSPQSSEVTQQVAAVHQASMQVRRLTPRECERLQGFPDDYTQVPHRGKPAADGPRYKALGNSMAVPCMAWIGRRIQMLEEQA